MLGYYDVYTIHIINELMNMHEFVIFEHYINKIIFSTYIHVFDDDKKNTSTLHFVLKKFFLMECLSVSQL